MDIKIDHLLQIVNWYIYKYNEKSNKTDLKLEDIYDLYVIEQRDEKINKILYGENK